MLWPAEPLDADLIKKTITKLKIENQTPRTRTYAHLVVAKVNLCLVAISSLCECGLT